MAVSLDLRVQRILQERYYNGEGVLRIPINLDKFRKKLAKEFPDLEPNLAEILERLEPELNAGVCRTFPLDKNGRFPNRVTVAERLRKVRPDLNEIAMEKALDVIEKRRMAASVRQPVMASASTPKFPIPTQPAAMSLSKKFVPLAVWIQSQYLEHGFVKAGFVGWTKFTAYLVTKRPAQEVEIRGIVPRLRVPGSSHELPNPDIVVRSRAAEQRKAHTQAQQVKQESHSASVDGTTVPPQSTLDHASLPAASNSSLPGLLQQSQHPKEAQSISTVASGSGAASRANGLNLRETQHSTILTHEELHICKVLPQGTRSSQTSTPGKLPDPAVPFQATVLAGSALPPDFSSLGQAACQAQGLQSRERNLDRCFDGVQISPDESDGIDRSNSSGKLLSQNYYHMNIAAPLSKEPSLLGGDMLARKLKQLQVSENAKVFAEGDVEQALERKTPNFHLTGKLLTRHGKHADTQTPNSGVERAISQAPLLSGSTIARYSKDLVPQYGLLGALAEEDEGSLASQLFLNTNVPFSTFICGVQGSGKSHTTSCILENAVIPSPNLGTLQSAASTLVFSYGEWSSGGAGFNISEATFLGTENPEYPGHSVKRVNVLISPSNPAIARLYQRLPNVQIIPFKLKAKTLDIGALRTLMAVDEKSTVPLYMARVEAILRGIAAESFDGSLDYTEFKKRLAEENFDPTQTNVLEMRLNLLESFLDMTGNAPEPDFRPGEVTIMDLSDAFISVGTACILFKLGLERFLQSPVSSRMVVLDEAHKYMLNTPGSKVLTDYLTRVVRLQRHQGARVVISTQEPTVSTDLIALCAITVMHRFTSPAWYAALRKHINAMEDDKATMQQIESLDTGEALIYAPNAVLGQHEDGSLVKATGQLLRVNVRDRVTLDGRASIMAI